MLRDINNLSARFGSPDRLEPRLSQYLPVDQAKSSTFAELKLDTPQGTQPTGSRFRDAFAGMTGCVSAIMGFSVGSKSSEATELAGVQSQTDGSPLRSCRAYPVGLQPGACPRAEPGATPRDQTRGDFNPWAPRLAARGLPVCVDARHKSLSSGRAKSVDPRAGHERVGETEPEGSADCPRYDLMTSVCR